MNVSIEYWYNGTDKVNLKHSEKNLSQFHFILH
jgi:hypothetical protein